MTGGLLLMAAALFLAGYNLWDQHRAEQTAREALAALEESMPRPDLETAPELDESQEVEIPDYVLNPKMEMPVVPMEGGDYIGVLEIPALNRTLPVMAQCSTTNLRRAPCCYAGTAYQENLVISGHNYRSHFGGLGNLRPGDEIRFWDMDGNLFSYTVAGMETLNPYAVEEMKAGDWPLSLFTCTAGGKNRLTVRCVLETE